MVLRGFIGSSKVRGRRDEAGAVAVIVALCTTTLMVGAGMILDFGLVRIDRQVDKSAADAATVAGLHALNGGDDKPHPFVGVCAAIQYLKANSDRFRAMSSTTGSWTTGTGSSTTNGCTDPTARVKICSAGSPATWAKFTWNGSWEGAPLKVVIQSGYQLAGSGWSEEDLAAAKADVDDGKQGCDQLAVVVTQARKPGLGSLATSSDLVSSIRSVGRVSAKSGSYAPAMLLLKRTGCPVLQSGAAGGASFIHVLGAVSSNGVTQPGTIHSDSDAGGGCTGGSNQNLFLGKANAGIVAYAAPTAGNPLVADSTKPGRITSAASQAGKAMNYARDVAANVYGSSALNGASAGSALKSEASGRNAVTRQPIDQRYLAGATAAMSQASSVFSTLAASTNPGLLGWVKLSTCKPTLLELAALNLTLTASSRLYVDCTSNGGFGGVSLDLTLNAGTVVFNGVIAPSATLSLPNAHHVYVAGNGTKDSIVLGGGTAKLKMNTAGNLDSSTGRCSTTRSASRAVLFVKGGDIKESTAGNLLQLCKTTVYMMGGSATGCVPTYDPLTQDAPATLPTSTPCSGGVGTGQFTQNGGDVDWTAPDQYDLMTDSTGNSLSYAQAAWSSVDGPEDLALWSESGTDSNSTYNMSGGGIFNVRGVYMVPNADPFTIGGGGTMTLGNAQFIASTIALNGNTTNITMSVDPNAAVTLPEMAIVGLVR